MLLERRPVTHPGVAASNRWRGPRCGSQGSRQSPILRDVDPPNRVEARRYGTGDDLTSNNSEAPWWQGTSIYQVYPRSFADSNGDGIGDIEGIISRLDYLARLGVETVWVSPFFAGPGRDFGYDITDYLSVASEYGTNEDARRLIEETHRQGMKIMFDLVLNHTSDEHPWFRESRSSRHNPKADWYIWADGRGRRGWRGRRPPNNWRSAMEVKSAWQWCEERSQWYLATFLPFQPDLNWRNPEVREAMFGAVRHWLDEGVDGFRLDIFGQIMKDVRLRSNPVRPNLSTGFPRWWSRRFTENTPDNLQLARDLRAVCAEYGDPDRILLGEVFGPPEVLREYLGGGGLNGGGSGGDGLNLVFLFEFLQYRYDAEWFRQIIARFEQAFPAPMQPTYVLENHDRTRSIERVGGDVAKARVLAVLLLTLRGVPTVYYGQELGMGNTPIPLRQAQDPVARTFFRWVPDFVARRLPETINRDEMRTPMQWTPGPNAGFCSAGVRPWLPVDKRYREVNVETEDGQPDSLLNLYRSLFRLRRDHEVLRTGRLRLLPNLPPDVVGFTREMADGTGRLVRATVLANLGKVDRAIPGVGGEVAVQAGVGRIADAGMELGPNSAAVLWSDDGEKGSGDGSNW